MKIISTNLSKPKTVFWKGKPVQTGIFKTPTNRSIELGVHDVLGDAVVDRQYHGGVHQACYLYSADHYGFWRGQFPGKDLPYGMFGENLTVEGLDETKLYIGASYQIGTAKVQISAPRQPCFKLGVRFEDQSVLKKMVNSTFCGTYTRVLETGKVKPGDEMILIKDNENALTVAEVFEMIYADSVVENMKQKLIANTFLPDDLKVKLVSRHGLR